MRYAQIRETDVSNGEGIRVSLFVQGCEFQCEGCFNNSAWDFQGGKLFTDQTIKDIIKLLNRPHIRGLTVLGGEPLHDKNYTEVIRLIAEVKKELPEKDIWLYSGYTYEQILDNERKRKALENVDVLVEGLFIEELKDLTLKFRGSSNQRIINVRKSQGGRVVECQL